VETIVVHQIWLQGRTAMPPDVLSSVESWCAATDASGHEHRLWDDASIRALLPDVGIPAVRGIYERLPEALRGVRADIARLVVLFQFGGLYADADTRPLNPHALFEHFESALRDGVDAVVGTADLHVGAIRRPSNFLLACPPRSRFVRAYLESIARDFDRLRIGDRLATIGLLDVRRLTKSWTGPRKLRKLLRAGGDSWAIRLTPVGFVASARQTCFADAVLAHDYRADWYDKSKAWTVVRDRALHALLDASLDRCIVLLVAIALLVVLAIAHGGGSQGRVTPQGATHSGFATGGGPHAVGGGPESISFILIELASAPPIER
jgi:glycosyl transferase-like sugar-binding protein